jgi:hypothetical protein
MSGISLREIVGAWICCAVIAVGAGAALTLSGRPCDPPQSGVTLPGVAGTDAVDFASAVAIDVAPHKNIVRRTGARAS